MFRVKFEKGSTVLQANAGAGHDETTAGAHVQAVDEAASIAVAIDDAEIDRVGTGHRVAIGHILGRACHVDILAASISILDAGEFIQRDLKDTGIADPLLGICKANTHALNHDVQTVDFAHVGQVIACRQVDGDDRCQPLAIGRALVERHTAIVGRDRLVPGGDVACHVVRRDPAAVALHMIAQFPGEFSPVDVVLALVGDTAQCLCQVGHTHEFAGAGRSAVDEQILGRLAESAHCPDRRYPSPGLGAVSSPGSTS